MRKTLLKLIEYSILPAILLFVGKLLGLYIIASLFGVPIDWQAEDKSLLFFSTSVAKENLMLVSTYSDLFMFTQMSLGMSFILIQAIYLHDSHISNLTISQLAKLNLLSLIRSSFELYHSGVIWLGFLWLGCILVAINYFQGISQLWVLLISLLFSISFSIIFFRDLFSEIELSKQNNYAG
jgi:hypothetical protein